MRDTLNRNKGDYEFSIRAMFDDDVRDESAEDTEVTDSDDELEDETEEEIGSEEEEA